MASLFKFKNFRDHLINTFSEHRIDREKLVALGLQAADIAQALSFHEKSIPGWPWRVTGTPSEFWKRRIFGVWWGRAPRGDLTNAATIPSTNRQRADSKCISAIHLHGVWLVEMAELASMSRAEES